jgi:argininosuccinate synthase
MNSVTAILDKIHNTPLPSVKKVAVAFSGGLDSSLCIELLRRVYKAQEIVAITINVGQGTQELEEVKHKAHVLGINPIIIDAQEEFAREWLPKAIQANSSYNGYPVSTSMTRQLVARLVAQEAVGLGCDALMEGSTGKGNDQYRMHNVFTLYAPNLKILVPVRDFNLSRGEEQELCAAWGVPVTEQITGGDDKTLWCRSIASGAIGLNQRIPDDVWLWLKPSLQASKEPEEIDITFEQGIPVSLNGQSLKLDALIEKLNVIGGKHGIGLIDIFEDGIMGLKSREIYEAPAAQIILKVHHDLELWCLTKEEIQFKKNVDNLWAYLIYHGMWYHPLKNALDAFIEKTQRAVNGTYKLQLYKGTITIVERYSQTGLFFPQIRSISSTHFDQRWCAQAAKIMGLPFEVLTQRGQQEHKGNPHG